VLGEFMHWADEFRGKFGVRANADIPRDAIVARKFGAEGIGLCRTEHMFFAEDRLPLVQAMIWRRMRRAAAKHSPSCFRCSAPTSPACSRRWTDSPLFIRTLDPPLHEFLPKRENLMVDLAKLPNADIKAKRVMSEQYGIPVAELKKRLPELLHRVEQLHEFNPMLGHPGCRLGITYPEITEMQRARHFLKALFRSREGHQGHSGSDDPADRSVEELENQQEDRGSRRN